mgnify:FL=1
MKAKNMEELIQKKYDELNENDLEIWKYIISNKETCKQIFIQQLAVFCHVSHTTILRFAKKLGFSGYSEMRSFLKWEEQAEILYEEKDMEKNANNFVATIRAMEDKDMTEICDMIDRAENIYVNGSGDVQKEAARVLKGKFLHQKIFVNTVEGGAEFGLIQEMIQPGDLVIFISYSGSNPIQLQKARFVKEKGANILLIAMEGKGEFRDLADAVLEFHPEEIHTIGYDYTYYPTLHFFILIEFLSLKYMEYVARKKGLE